MGIAQAGEVITEADGLALAGTWAAGVASAGQVMYGGAAVSDEWPETDTGQLRGFYIASDGSDGNTGSKAQPWATLAHVNGFAAQPGDAFMFRAGDTFAGGLNVTASGTAANPVFYRSYGESTERATIQGGVHLLNVAYGTVRDLVVTGGNHGVNVEANSPDQTKYAGNQLLNLDVSGANQTGILVQNSLPANSTDGHNPGFTNLLIDGCVAHDNGQDGINTWCDWWLDWGGMPDPRKLSHANLTIRNCISHHNNGVNTPAQSNGGSGIIMSGTDGGLVENCVAYQNGLQTPSWSGGLGIWCFDCNNVVLRFCESYANWSNGPDGDGFDIDGGATNCIFEYCYSHGNKGNGLQYWVYDGAPPTHSNTYRFCISENDGVGDQSQQAGSFFSLQIGQSDNGTYGTVTYHNCVAFQSRAGNYLVGRVTNFGSPAPAVIENCILIAGAGVGTAAFPADPHTYNTNNFAGTLSGLPNSNANPKMWPHGLNSAGNGGTVTPVGETPTPAMFAAWTPYQLAAISQNIGVGAALGFDPGPQDMFGNQLAGSALSIGAECPFVTPPAQQPWHLLNSVMAQSPTTPTTSFTTAPIDTTGANLIVVAAWIGNISDSYGNTWLQAGVFAYCLNPVAGPGHTFTNFNAQYGAIIAAAFQHPNPKYDKNNIGTDAGFVTAVQATPLTPSAGNALVLTAYQGNGNASAVDSGFGIIGIIGHRPGVATAVALASLVQATAAPLAPTWTVNPNSAGNYASMITFVTS